MKNMGTGRLKTTIDISKKTSAQDPQILLHWIRAGLFLLAFLLTLAILLFERPNPMSGEFLIGEPAPRTLFSPFELSYVNEKATDSSRQTKSLTVPSVLTVAD